MGTPPFLDHLGLSEEVADEREIKRAYARLLKQIDQEADPAGFQKLREAYETSIGWFGWRAHQQAMQAQEEAQQPAGDAAAEVMAVTESHEAATSETPAETTHTGDPRGRHIDEVLPVPVPEAVSSEAAPEPEIPRPQAHATALFDEHFSEPCREDDTAARLAACLDDDRLIDLEARAIFEYRVAHALAEGYTEGKHFLWKAAQTTFGWDEDHTRLRQFGRAGQVLENALNEQDFFERQDELRITYQARIMERLRGDQMPHETEFSNLIPPLEWMLATYPNLMWISTKAENVHKWREHHQKLPFHLQAAQASGQDEIRTPPAPAPQAQESSSKGSYWVFMLCFMGLMTMLRFMGGSHSPSSDNLQPAERVHMQETLDRANQAAQAASAAGATIAPLELGGPMAQEPQQSVLGESQNPFKVDPPFMQQSQPTAQERLERLKRERQEMARALEDAKAVLKDVPQRRETRPRQPMPSLQGVGDSLLEMPQIAPSDTPVLQPRRDGNKLDGEINHDNVKLGGS